MPGPVSQSYEGPFDAPAVPITCDAVRALVESAGKRWAVVISGTPRDTQFTTWGQTAEDKLYASDLSSYLAQDLCPGAPETTYESFHDKATAARNKEELERLRAILEAPQTMLFADGRQPTENERHLSNLLSWRQKEAAEAREAAAVLGEQLSVATARAQRFRDALLRLASRDYSGRDIRVCVADALGVSVRELEAMLEG